MRQTKILTSILILMTIFGHASAITYGEPDGNRHPNVGALISPHGFTFLAYCSGVLIAPKVFLTAAHCGHAPDKHPVKVTFDSEITSRNSQMVVEGTFIAHPEYPGKGNNSFDIAIVLFETEQNAPVAQLPAPGEFDRLKLENRDQQFTAVGYGLEEAIPSPGGITYNVPNARRVSTPSLVAVNKVWLTLLQNPATGDSGTCFGDSGAPNFVGPEAAPTDVVAAITITGDAICRATNVVFRLDTPMARNFLQNYVALP